MKQRLLLLSVFVLISSPIFAQGHGHGGGHHGMWPDSLETITLTGTVIIDSTHFMPMYYLDTNDDNEADYHLSFGPYWYEPASGATRPNDDENITIVGAEWRHEFEETTIIVYEINGLEWREPIEGGMHGWDGDHFWGDLHDQIIVSGTVLIDSSYYYTHYFLDVDSNETPEYMLNFGPPWYMLENEPLLPINGQVVTITGGEHEMAMMGIPSLMVFEINGQKWRDPVGPPPWSGNWMHRNDIDTGYVFCPTDSLDWMGHPPESMMGMMMGGGMFPDSIYCQFEEMYPDFLPGQHDSTLFAGYYMNMYDPAGQTMMGNGGTMGGMNGMRFNRPTNFHFHYDEDHLNQMRLSDEEIQVKYWETNSSTWQSVDNFTVDRDKNIISFSNYDMSNYYALFGEKIVTGVEKESEQILPDQFTLYQNYPNPFNPETTIKFYLSNQSQISLTIYNIVGQKIKTLAAGILESGIHQITWNGADEFNNQVPSGIYFINLKLDNQRQIAKMSLIK